MSDDLTVRKVFLKRLHDAEWTLRNAHFWIKVATDALDNMDKEEALFAYAKGLKPPPEISRLQTPLEGPCKKCKCCQVVEIYPMGGPVQRVCVNCGNTTIPFPLPIKDEAP